MTDPEIYRNFINKALNSSKKLNIIGDCLIDEFYQVRTRFNPESNLPAYTIIDEPTAMAGGAGNIAYCLSNMPLEYRLYGCLDDYARKCYEASGISTKRCTKTKHTPRKQRYYNENTLLQRIDQEYALLDCNIKSIKDADVNIFSDYAKGFLKKLWFKNYLHNALVDPKPSGGVSKWAGAMAIKCNAKEAFELTRTPSLKEQINLINKISGINDVIVTKSGDGVSGISSGHFFEIGQPLINAKNIIGAGDCFMAFFSYAKALDFDTISCCRIAMLASSTYVMKRDRTAPKLYDFITDKYVDNVNIFANRDFKLVFTNGCFDIIHAGHIECLKFAKSKGDRLIVAINSDESVSRLKGNNRPINKIMDRLKVITALDMVDYVTVFDDNTPYDLINRITPDVLIKGSPYTIDTVVGSDVAKETFIFENYNGLSSSKLITSSGDSATEGVIT